MPSETREGSPTDVPPHSLLCRGVLPRRKGSGSAGLRRTESRLTRMSSATLHVRVQTWRVVVQCLARPGSARDNRLWPFLGS